MQKINFLFVVLAGLIPMITGFIWYSKALFGNAWMKASGTTEEKMKGSNMAVILLVSLLFSMLVALFMMPVVIHQFGILSVLVKEPGINDPGSEIGRYIADFMGKYGSNFRTFKHGAFHGTLAALLFASLIIYPVGHSRE